MRHTLKAVFEHRSDAQHVLDELLASGYPRADLALADISTTEPTGLGTTLRHTAARLLGTRHDQDAEAQRHVVTLTTESDPEAERAADIIARAHPAGLEDILDEHAAGAMSAAPRRRYPPGTAPGSLQHHPHEDSHYFGTQNAGAPPAGNTYQETLGSIARWSDPDEVDPFDLGAVPEPTGADDLRADDNRPGQTWEDVEPALKSDWERRHPGSAAAAWEKVKAAVRHGWERARH